MKNDKYILGFAIILIQFFDIIIHVATDQIEPIRIISNIVLVLWVFGILLKPKVNSLTIGIGSIVIYLLLNIIFVFQEGLTNHITGEPRTVLFLLVGLSIILSGVLVRRRS